MNTLITKEEYNKLYASRQLGSFKYAIIFGFLLGLVVMIVSGFAYLMTGDMEIIWNWYPPSILIFLISFISLSVINNKMKKTLNGNLGLKAFLEHETSGTKVLIYEERIHDIGKEAVFTYFDYMIVFENKIISLFVLSDKAEFLESFESDELTFEFNHEESKFRLYVDDHIEPIVYGIYYELIKPLKSFLKKEGYHYKEK